MWPLRAELCCPLPKVSWREVGVGAPGRHRCQWVVKLRPHPTPWEESFCELTSPLLSRPSPLESPGPLPGARRILCLAEPPPHLASLGGLSRRAGDCLTWHTLPGHEASPPPAHGPVKTGTDCGALPRPLTAGLAQELPSRQELGDSCPAPCRLGLLTWLQCCRCVLPLCLCFGVPGPACGTAFPPVPPEAHPSDLP